MANDAVAAPAPAADRTLRRQRTGWYGYYWASHTFETSVLTVFMSRYLTAVAQNAAGGADGRLSVVGIPVAPGSLFSYILTTCAVALVILMPIVGALADRTGRKREMLLGLGYTGGLACTAMVFIGPTDWVLGTVLLVVAYLAYSCAMVVYNSLLPDLAGPEERDRVSSLGWGAGYVGGGILLAATFVVSFFLTDNALLARIGLCAAGVWWLVFMVVPLRRLVNLPAAATQRTPVRGSVVTAGFRQLGSTLADLRHYRWTLLFLVAFLVYYDGISTVVTLSAQYGQFELHLSENTLLTAILIVQFAAFGGALLLNRFASRWGAKRVIAYSLLVWIGIVVAAYFMQVGSAVQFYLLALGLSIVMGGTQALSRSLFAHMIPAGHEAEYYSLYEISSSGTSAIGPLIFGLTLQNTGSYRLAIFSLIAFFVIGLLLLVPVNVRRAIRAAGNTPPANLVRDTAEGAAR